MESAGETLAAVLQEDETTLQGPHFGDPILQRIFHTHSSCREGRWENIRSLISKKVPLTRLLQGKRRAEGCPGCFQEMPTQVCSWPHPPPELHPIPPWDEATCVWPSSPQETSCLQCTRSIGRLLGLTESLVWLLAQKLSAQNNPLASFISPPGGPC